MSRSSFVLLWYTAFTWSATGSFGQRKNCFYTVYKFLAGFPVLYVKVDINGSAVKLLQIQTRLTKHGMKNGFLEILIEAKVTRG